ncbi:MAG: pyruvate formate lyase family protein, partial [Oscillospiraceae bacterium]|nr:pyruvate formate lyase family protein [Oscillospiraceae bacterium]
MSERIESIKKSIRESMQRKKKWLGEGTSVFEAFPGIEKKALIVRNAEAVRLKFSRVPLCIWENQLLAGSIVIPGQNIMISGSLPDYATPEEKEAAAKEGVSTGSIVGHIVPSYPKLLKYGTLGIKQDALDRLKSAKDPESAAFYEAVAIVMDALDILACRYGAYCMEQSKKTADPTRKKELCDMASDLAFAPKNPAGSFAQAAASIWLVHFAFQLTGNHLAIGR